MATYNLAQLDFALIQDGYTQNTRAQVENYLKAEGFFTTPTSTIDAETAPGDPSANLLIFHPPSSETIPTGLGTANADLSYILDPAVGITDLTVTGGGNIGISLTTGAESLTLATSGNDVVFTGFGTETINATTATGNDTIYAQGSGTATVMAGAGADTLEALAGSGATLFESGSVHGGPATSTYDYSSAADTFVGGAGNDTLYSNNTVGDTLEAGSGNQRLQSNVGANSLLGGTGADTLVSTSSGNDTLHGGSGPNELLGFGSGSDQFISGSLSTGPGTLIDDYGSTTSTLQGGAGADSIYANNSAGDSMYSGTGSDQALDGFIGGNNSITAGANSGNDDTLGAGTGNDTLNASLDPNFVALYSGAGNSTLEGGSNAEGYFGILSNGDDTVHITTGTGSTTSYVDMTTVRASGAVTSGLPADGSTNTNVTLTFGNGQNIDVASSTGTTVVLEFSDKNVTYNG